MSGTLAGPVFALAGAPAGAIRLPHRLWAAIAIAVALHAVVLAIRPGGLNSNYVAPASKVIAVRMVRPLALPESVVALVQGSPEPLSSLAAAQVAQTAPTAPTAPSERHVAQATTAKGRLAGEISRVPAGALASRSEPKPASSTVAPPAQPSASEPALPAAPDYAFGVRLDPGPRPLDEIEPDYPDVVHLREGTVVLRLLISDTGHVDDVEVVRSQPRGVFEQAAIDAFAKARFAPGMAAGTPVKSQITVEVQFVPINRGARVSGRTY